MWVEVSLDLTGGFSFGTAVLPHQKSTNAKMCKASSTGLSSEISFKVMWIMFEAIIIYPILNNRKKYSMGS